MAVSYMMASDMERKALGLPIGHLILRRFPWAKVSEAILNGERIVRIQYHCDGLEPEQESGIVLIGYTVVCPDGSFKEMAAPLADGEMLTDEIVRRMFY